MKPPLGSGARFRKLEHTLEGHPGVYSPGGLAATIGRRKYGMSRFQNLSVKGRVRRRIGRPVPPKPVRGY